MLRVGLIGVGGISGAHIPVWEKMEDAELVALCDGRAEKLEAYPQKRCYTDFDEMLKTEALDILDICLPTYLHAEYAVKALKKGIHVLCEKPVSLKKEDVRRIYDTAKENGVCFMVAHVLRFWPEYELLKEIFDTKKYGALLSGYMGRLGRAPRWSWDGWMHNRERSGLVPFDLHIHDLDFLVYMLGKPSNVKANRSTRPGADFINAVYEYPSCFVETEAAWYACNYPFSARFRFQFEEAVAAFEGGKMVIYENNGTVLDLTQEAEGDTGAINLPKSDAYGEEIRYFTDCVKSGVFPDKVKPEELETVLDILEKV